MTITCRRRAAVNKRRRGEAATKDVFTTSLLFLLAATRRRCRRRRLVVLLSGDVGGGDGDTPPAAVHHVVVVHCGQVAGSNRAVEQLAIKCLVPRVQQTQLEPGPFLAKVRVIRLVAVAIREVRAKRVHNRSAQLFEKRVTSTRR